MNVWRLITHNVVPDRALEWAKNNQVLAIGWDGVGNIETMGYRSSSEIADAIRQHHPGRRNDGAGGICLWEFCYTMRPGDLVILSTGKRRDLVMEVDPDRGEYRFKEEPEAEPIGGYQHQRTAKYLPIDPDVLWQLAGAGPVPGQSIRWTLIRCRESINPRQKQELMSS